MRLFQRTTAMCLLGIVALSARLAWAQSPASLSISPRSLADSSALPPPASAAATSPAGSTLSLAQAQARAQASNPGLRSAERDIEAAEGAVDQGAALPNPTLSYEMEDTNKATRTNTAILSQALELGGKRAARITAAERGRDLAGAQLRVRQSELKAQVRSSWHEVLAEQAGQGLADEVFKLAQASTKAAARRVQAGSASPLEETRARLEELNAKLAQAQAEASLARARNRLAALWGQTQADFVRVEGTLDELPTVPQLEALLSRIEETPGMRMATHEAARREALAGIERSRRYPDLTVSVGLKRDAELGRNQSVFGLSVPLPLFDSNRGNVREAQARSTQAQDDLHGVRANLSSELLQARSRMSASRLEADGLAREVIPAAQSALEASTRGYALGKFGFIDLLDAQRSLFQVRSQHLRAWLDTHKAAAEIARLLGDEGEYAIKNNPNTP